MIGFATWTTKIVSPFYRSPTPPIKVKRASGSHSSPDLQSAGADAERLLCKGGTTDSLCTALSRNTQVGTRQEEIQDALQKELEALKDEVLLHDYEELTYKPYPDAKQDPLPTTGMGRAKMEEMIEVKVLRSVDEIIGEHLTQMMTAMIPRCSAISSRTGRKPSCLWRILFRVL